jgi:hypothetical protein
MVSHITVVEPLPLVPVMVIRQTRGGAVHRIEHGMHRSSPNSMVRGCSVSIREPVGKRRAAVG